FFRIQRYKLIFQLLQFTIYLPIHLWDQRSRLHRFHLVISKIRNNKPGTIIFRWYEWDLTCCGQLDICVKIPLSQIFIDNIKVNQALVALSSDIRLVKGIVNMDSVWKKCL